MKIDLNDYMTHENVLDFIRILHEHRDEKGRVNLQLPSGEVIKMQLNTKINPPRSIDSEWRADNDV